MKRLGVTRKFNGKKYKRHKDGPFSPQKAVNLGLDEKLHYGLRNKKYHFRTIPIRSSFSNIYLGYPQYSKHELYYRIG